ncbi:MAG: hypothetical protein ACTTKL_04620 [Treponema sp.]
MKKICAALVFAALNFACAAEIVNFFTPRMQWTLTGGINVKHAPDLAFDSAASDTSVTLDMKELSAAAGFRLQNDIFDFTAQAAYAPTIARRFNIGVQTIFHVNAYSNIFTEVDFLTGVYFKFDTLKRFSIAAHFSYLYKEARIFAIADAVPRIYNHNIAHALELTFRPRPALSLYAGLSSHTFYRYALYFSPTLKLGGEYRLFDWFSLGSEWSAQYIDIFTLSANFNGFENRFFIKLRF